MKIVCWGDYAIPLPNMAKWISRDSDGQWVWHEDEPMTVNTYSVGWWNSRKKSGSFSWYALPPESGPWHTQKYWLEDM